MSTTKKTTPNNPLDKILGKYFAAQQAVSNGGLKDLELLDFIVAASPIIHSRPVARPVHLSKVLPYFEAIEHSPQFFCFSAPPRHGKSILTNHAVARLMLRKPGLKVAYGCYSLDLSRDWFSGEVKDILVNNGFQVNRHQNTKEEWSLTNGSSFKAVAPGSGFTGRGADLIIIDDPYKDRAHAESGKIRETTWNWVRDVCITRRSPKCSVVVTHTRWHHEDVIGVLSRGDPKIGLTPKPFINLEAIDAEKKVALWEDEWSYHRLMTEVKPILGEYGWASLYMGNPIPRGGAVFNDANFYSDLDMQALIEEKKIVRYVIGIDCAYTEKTHSDYSVAVVLAIDTAGVAYVVDVRREQCKSPRFASILRELRLTWYNAPIYWYTGGTEGAVAEYFRNSAGIPVKDVPAREDKFVRSQAVAAAWNAGRVKVPFSANWLSEFVNEILVFTGLDDPHDDQVDALAAAYIPQSKPRIPRGNSPVPIIPFG